MNIVLSLGSLASLNANANIVIILARRLANKGNKVYVIGQGKINKDLLKVDDIEILGFDISKAEKTWDDFLKKNEKLSHKIKLIKFSIKHPMHSLFILKSSFYGGALNYKIQMNKFIKKNNISAVVAFSLPFEVAYASLLSNKLKTKIYYQLDPFGLFEYAKEDKAKLVKSEIKMIEKADKTITTFELYNQYSNDIEYKKYLHKYVPVKFPLVFKRNSTKKNNVFDYKDSDINVIFCGTLRDGHRNPQFLLDLLKPIIKKNNNVKIYFLGNIDSDVLNAEKQFLDENIIIHETVEVERATEALMNADVLINIGNNISNMVPSKIFDYFSIGKPILNIQKITDCPASKYFAKYPLQFTINETQGVNSEIQSQLESFILSAKGKTLDFNETESIFFDATPEFVSNEIIKIINS